MTSHSTTTRPAAITSPLERIIECLQSSSGSRRSTSARRSSGRSARPTAPPLGQSRSIRSQVGESIIRLGRRVAGESLGSPALTG